MIKGNRCHYLVKAKHTTPSIPYKVKKALMLVSVAKFITGRMALSFKTGVRASRRAAGFG